MLSNEEPYFTYLSQCRGGVFLSINALKTYWFTSCTHIQFIERDHIVPLEPELVMSTPTYDPLGTETTYKSKLFLCQMGHTQNGHNQFWLYGDDILSDVSFANTSETDSNICFSNYCWSFWSHLFSALKWFVNKNIEKKVCANLAVKMQ